MKHKRELRTDGIEQKKHLYETAKRLFLMYGENVSAKKICEAAKLNSSAINYYFESKEQLLAKVREEIYIPTYNELKEKVDFLEKKL